MRPGRSIKPLQRGLDFSTTRGLDSTSEESRSQWIRRSIQPRSSPPYSYTRHEVRLYAQAGRHYTPHAHDANKYLPPHPNPQPRTLSTTTRATSTTVRRSMYRIGSHTLAPIRHRPHRRGHTNAHTHRASCLPRAAPPSTPLRVLTGPHRARSAEHRTRPWRRRAGCRCSHCRRPGCRCPRTRPSPSSA